MYTIQNRRNVRGVRDSGFEIPALTRTIPDRFEANQSVNTPKKAYEFAHIFGGVRGEYVFTKNSLFKVREQVQNIGKQGPSFIYLQDIDGIGCRLTTPYDVGLMLQLNSIFVMADADPTHNDDEVNTPEAFYFKLCPFFPVRSFPPTEFQVPDIASKIQGWQQNWAQSKYLGIIDDFFDQNAEKARKIDKIICFGLGNVADSVGNDTQHAEIIFVRHLAACHIAYRIGNLKCGEIDNAAGTSTPIRILAQDAAYTPVFAYQLRELGIEVVDFHVAEGLAQLTEDSFVISLDAPDLYMRACIDLTEGKGPAGMLSVERAEDHEKVWTGEDIPIELYKGYQPWITSKEFEYSNACIKTTFEADPTEPWFDIKEYCTYLGQPPTELFEKRQVAVELFLK